MKNMTVKTIIEMIELVDDDTEVIIRSKDMHMLTRGNWYQDNILRWMEQKVECFTAQDDNKLYIDLKEV